MLRWRWVIVVVIGLAILVGAGFVAVRLFLGDDATSGPECVVQPDPALLGADLDDRRARRQRGRHTGADLDGRAQPQCRAAPVRVHRQRRRTAPARFPTVAG